MQLIATVADAVGKLQSKFTLKYEASAAARVSRLRGLPPVSGKILWAKQMERQVQTLVERMGNVLGVSLCKLYLPLASVYTNQLIF